MTFADPQSVDIGAGAISLPRVSTGNLTATYLSADGNLEYVISHIRGKQRIRRVARINVRKTAADPLFPAQNAPYSASVFFNIDVPIVGFSATEALNISKGLFGNLSASTYANLVKLTQSES